MLMAVIMTVCTHRRLGQRGMRGAGGQPIFMAGMLAE